MSIPRQLPTITPRVATGPARFGDDWPGLWLDSQACVEYAVAIDAALRSEDLDRLTRAQLAELRKLLAFGMV